MKDYYKILGIDKNASPEEIKKAYRKKVLQYHPDRDAGSKEYEDKIKEINEANEVLSDDAKRHAYDHPSPFNSTVWNPFNFFSEQFGINFDGFTVNFGNIVQKNIKIGLGISLSDAYCGCKKNITYKRITYHQEKDGRIYTSNKTESLSIDIPEKIARHSILQFPHKGNIDINGNEGNLQIQIDYPIEEKDHLVQRDGTIICLLHVPMIKILREDAIQHHVLGNKENIEIKLDSTKKNGDIYIFPQKGFNNSNFIARIFYDIPVNIKKEDREQIIGVLKKYG